MGYDYSYQIYQELLGQGKTLDELEAMLQTQGETLVSVLSKMDQYMNVLTLIAVIGFGILLFNIIMKWVKKN